MKGKFLKIRRVVIPTLTIVIMASQLMGCSSTSKDQVSSMLEKGEQIEIELVIEDNGAQEQGERSAIVWVKLGELATYPKFRSAMESNFNVTTEDGIKQGSLYINLDGSVDKNNTLYNVLSNKAVVDLLNTPEVQENLSVAIQETYADLEDSDTSSAIYNCYFNLLPDNVENYYNGGTSLTRAESMALVMRAITPVQYLDTNEDFVSAVTAEEATDYDAYAPYAAYLNDKAYLNTSDESLNEKTFTGKMTRGEYIYLVLNTIYTEDEIASASGTLSDCTEGTDLSGDTHKSILSAGLKNDQAPTDIYKALLKANSIGVIQSETRWSEAITRSEAIDILADTIIAYNEAHGYPIDTLENGSDEQYKKEAHEAYEENKDEIDGTEEQFTAFFVEARKQGDTVAEATDYGKVNTISEEKVEEILNKQESPAESKEETPQAPNTSNTDTGNSGSSGGNTSSGGGNTSSGGGNTGSSGSGNTSSGGTGNTSSGGNTTPQPTPQQPATQPTPQQPSTPSTPSGWVFDDTPADNDWSGTGTPVDWAD